MSVETEGDYSQNIYLKATQVRQRYGNCSNMWITRRQRDEGFPAPDYFGGLRFWKLGHLERWERERKAAPKSRPARDMKAVRS
jgi:hypothetical protein